jgi:hypothetical protein
VLEYRVAPPGKSEERKVIAKSTAMDAGSQGINISTEEIVSRIEGDPGMTCEDDDCGLHPTFAATAAKAKV